MKLEKEHGIWTLTLGKMSFIEFWNDWHQLFGKYNWYTFDFIKISAEKDEMIEGYELELKLLGLGVRIRVNTNENNEIIQREKEVEQSAKDCPKKK